MAAILTTKDMFLLLLAFWVLLSALEAVGTFGCFGCFGYFGCFWVIGYFWIFWGLWVLWVLLVLWGSRGFVGFWVDVIALSWKGPIYISKVFVFLNNYFESTCGSLKNFSFTCLIAFINTFFKDFIPHLIEANLPRAWIWVYVFFKFLFYVRHSEFCNLFKVRHVIGALIMTSTGYEPRTSRS